MRRRWLCRCCWWDECWLPLGVADGDRCCWLMLLVAADWCCWSLLLVAACWLLLLIAVADCCCWLLLLVAAVDRCCWLLLGYCLLDGCWLLLEYCCCLESLWIFMGCRWFEAKIISQAKQTLNIFGCWWFVFEYFRVVDEKSLNISGLLMKSFWIFPEYWWERFGRKFRLGEIGKLMVASEWILWLCAGFL